MKGNTMNKAVRESKEPIVVGAFDRAMNDCKTNGTRPE
jgi:hypothetical protein